MVLEIRRDGDGNLVLTGLDATMVETLVRIPILLESDQWGELECLIPEPFQYRPGRGLPEAAALVERELARIEPEDAPREYSLAIPPDRRNLWLEMLSLARFLLCHRHRLAPGDTEIPLGETDDQVDPDRLMAQVQVNILAFLHALIRSA